MQLYTGVPHEKDIRLSVFISKTLIFNKQLLYMQRFVVVSVGVALNSCRLNTWNSLQTFFYLRNLSWTIKETICQ